MTEASVVAVGTPQSFRQQIARALEVETEEVGWVQSATAAEELLINAFTPIDVLVLSPEVKEPDALGLAEFVGTPVAGDRDRPGARPHVERAAARRDAGRHPRRRRHDPGDGGAPRCRGARRGVGHQPALDGRRAPRRARTRQRGHIISVFSSKGGTGKTFLTTNLATAISDITGEDTAVVDLDIDMGDVFTYFGREPSARVDDLMGLGEGRRPRPDPRASASQFGEHLWGFGAPPDPAAEAPAGEAIGQVPADAPQRVLATWSSTRPWTTRTRRSSASTCPTRSAWSRGLDVVGVKHLSKALDTLLTIGLPRERFRVVLNRAD